MAYLLVSLGAEIGGALRHAANSVCARLGEPGFPWGILTNATGSLVMGLAAGRLASNRAPAGRAMSILGLLAGLSFVRAVT
jgi:CrcB protein